MSPQTNQRQRRRRIAAAPLVAMILVLAGCSGSDDVSVTASPGGGDVLSPATFEGEAMSVSGETVDLATLADRDLILWFWAPW